jgi:hypothetical protein
MGHPGKCLDHGLFICHVPFMSPHLKQTASLIDRIPFQQRISIGRFEFTVDLSV